MNNINVNDHIYIYIYIYIRGSRQSAYPVFWSGVSLLVCAAVASGSIEFNVVAGMQPFIWCEFKFVFIQLVGANAGIVSWFACLAIQHVQCFLLCQFVDPLQWILPTCYVGNKQSFLQLALPCRRLLCLITRVGLVKFQAIVLSPCESYLVRRFQANIN